MGIIQELCKLCVTTYTIKILFVCLRQGLSVLPFCPGILTVDVVGLKLTENGPHNPIKFILQTKLIVYDNIFRTSN